MHAEPHQAIYTAISPYLFGASSSSNHHIVVRESSQILNGFPPIKIGSQPIDDQNFILNEGEKKIFLKAEPGARKFIRPYIGSKEFLQGHKRWILDLT